MSAMTKDEILHLGTLSRIALSPTEVETFSTEIDAILQYVSTISEIIEGEETEPTVGARYNVLRKDEVTNNPGEFTERLLEALPEREGQYMSVKKILNQDE